MKYLLALTAVCITYVSTQTPGCDYYQQVQAGQSFSIQSPGYPANYGKGLSCRWIAQCVNARCRVDCVLSMPTSSQCSADRLLISKSGDPQLYGAEVFCGQGSTTLTSVGNDISLGLITSSTSVGGRFQCQITSVPTSTPSTCSCGYKKTNRIVGGVETKVNEFPAMAGLVDVNTASIYCGAVIIDKSYLLTAAHCLLGKNRNAIAVVVGEHNVNTNDSAATQVYRVSDYITHPQYNQNNNDYDVALILVANTITFSDRVGPICLPFKFQSSTLAGRKVTALGWGTLFFGGPTSDTLQKVDLDVITDDICRQKGVTITSRQFCTYTQGKDTCQVDSGGTLLYTDPATNLYFNLGIISYGIYCATSRPSVNTKVTSILSWIVENTPDVNYCVK